MDLDTVFAISKFFVTIPAAKPYFVLFALLIASSIVLFFIHVLEFIIHEQPYYNYFKNNNNKQFGFGGICITQFSISIARSPITS